MPDRFLVSLCVLRCFSVFVSLCVWPDHFTTSVFRLPTSVFRLLASDFRLPTCVFRLQSSDFRLPSSDFRLPTSVFRLLASVFRLPSSDFCGLHRGEHFNFPFMCQCCFICVLVLCRGVPRSLPRSLSDRQLCVAACPVASMAKSSSKARRQRKQALTKQYKELEP